MTSACASLHVNRQTAFRKTHVFDNFNVIIRLRVFESFDPFKSLLVETFTRDATRWRSRRAPAASSRV